ncbi:unnamed protein product [Medioppia subpectinata]|uniref:Uncharacterized protein n=1 Tax=Medioppia subpectinata TaxID=1979941 RepID=A0A7R9L3Z4_9ACAR|nr:unnamed protein product [Medioppia subpectinata]CAG2115131.1 unnamed protein product [Medioppia subpectinata]
MKTYWVFIDTGLWTTLSLQLKCQALRQYLRPMRRKVSNWQL